MFTPSFRSSRGSRSMTDLDADAVIVGSGPAGSAVAQVLTDAGWSVIMLEKGRNHLLDLDAPYEPLGHLSNDELKLIHRHLLGPDPLVEPRTYRRSPDDGDHLVVGHVNSLPSTVGGGGYHADAKLPRLREDDFRLLSTFGPQDDASVADWPFAYADLEPYYAEVERIVGVAGEETNPFAAWRSVAVSHAARTRHVRRRAVHAGGRAGRPAPLPGAHRHQLGALRRPAGLQQLRVLRLVRVPHRRQGRSGGAAAPGSAHRPARGAPRVPGDRGDPGRHRPPSHRRALPGRGSGSSTRCGPITWCWPPAPSRRPG